MTRALQVPKATLPVPPPESGFATTRDAAQFLRLSHPMVRKMVTAGDIPVKRFGRSVRIRWAWLRTQAEEDGR